MQVQKSQWSSNLMLKVVMLKVGVNWLFPYSLTDLT